MHFTADFPTAMCTASPRAQLHMLHVQDRLHGGAQNAAAAQTRVTAVDKARALSPPASHRPVGVHGSAAAAAGRLSHGPADTTSSQQHRSSSRVHGRRSRSRGVGYGPNPSHVMPRRGSSSGCSVSQRRTSVANGLRQERPVRHGFDAFALYGIPRDTSPTRRTSPACSAPRTVRPRCVMAAVAEHPSPHHESIPHTVQAATLADVAAAASALEPATASPLLPLTQSVPILKPSPVSVVRVESSHLGVSALSIQVESSRHGLMSEQTVSLVVSDTDDDPLEM